MAKYTLDSETQLKIKIQQNILFNSLTVNSSYFTFNLYAIIHT